MNHLLDGAGQPVNEETLSSAKKWAADVLEVPAGTTAVTARHAFWRLLPTEGFWPYDVHVEAVTLFTSQPAVLIEWQSDAFSAENEAKIREAIEKFAGQFFLLPPGDRKSRWLRLMQHAKAYPRLRIRLERLQLGLGVVCDKLSCSEGAHQVIQACATLFLALPTKRADTREKLLGHFRQGESQWKESLAEAKRVLPEIMHFAPDLLEELANSRGIEARKVTVARVRPRSLATTAAEPSSNRVRILIAVLMAIGVGVGFVSSASKSNRKPAPSYELRQISPQEREQAHKHILEMLERSRQNKLKSSTDPNNSIGTESPNTYRDFGGESRGYRPGAPHNFAPGLKFPPGSPGPSSSTGSEQGP